MSASSTQRGRLAAERRLAQLRRAPRDAERGVDLLLGRARPGAAERVDVGGRAGRAQRAPCRSARGSAATQLDRHALDGDADARAARPARSPRRSAAARRSARAPARDRRAAQTTASCSQASRQRRGSPAGSPPSAAAIPPTSSRARLSMRPRGGAARRLAGERLEQLRLGLRPDAGHVAQPPGRGRLAELLRRATPSAAGDLDRALRAPGRGSGRGRSSPGASSRSSSASSAMSPGLDAARAAAPRCPGRSRAARARGPARRAPRPAAAWRGSVSAARR